MHYSNPKIPEGINYSKEHPLKNFLILTMGVIGIVVLVITLVSFLCSVLAHYIPFKYELAIADSYERIFSEQKELNAEEQAIEDYLNKLAQGLIQHQSLDEDIHIKVHYLNDPDVVNAFATLGGNIVIYQGLLDKVDSENALAFVLSHEIAHIKYRHPISSLSSGIIISILMAIVTGSTDNALNSNVLGGAGLLTTLSFSRKQETDADMDALKALHGYYGHVAGATAFFEWLGSKASIIDPPQFMNTHPDSNARLQLIKKTINDNKWRENEAKLRAMPFSPQ